MNSEAYIKIVHVELVAYCARLGGKKFIFQQVRTPCHPSRTTKKLFEERNINVFSWPSNSKDLNVI